MSTENDNATSYVGYTTFGSSNDPTKQYIGSYQGYERPTDGLFPNGVFNELSTGMGYAFSSTTRPWPNYVNLPAGQNQTPALYSWLSKKQFSDARALSAEIDAKNTEQTVSVAVEKIAKTLGLSLEDPLLNTIRQMAYKVAEYSPYIKDIVGRVVNQLADGDDSLKSVADQISGVLDMLVGPAGSTAVLETAMEQALSPYMSSYNANAVISEFIAKEYSPGTDGKTVSRMTTEEMGSLINFMSNRGATVFDFNEDKVNKVIRSTLTANPSNPVLSSEEKDRLNRAQIRRSATQQQEALNKGWAMAESIKRLGNVSDSDKKAITAYVQAAESSSGLKHTIAKTLEANNIENVNVDLLTTAGTEEALADLNKAKHNIIETNQKDYAKSEQYKQLDKTIKEITTYKEAQQRAYETTIKDTNDNSIDTAQAINSLFQSNTPGAETIEAAYTKQLSDYYTGISAQFNAGKSNVKYNVTEVAQAKKDMLTLQRYGYSYADFKGNEGDARLAALKADDRIDPELIATINRLKEESITEKVDETGETTTMSKAEKLLEVEAEANRFTTLKTDTTVKEYNTKLLQLEKATTTAKQDSLKQDIDKLEETDVIRQYKAIIAARDGALKMERMASSYKVFQGALVATGSASNRSSIDIRRDGDVFKAMDMITQGSITNMSTENFTKELNTISSLMIASNANIDTSLQFSGLAAQTAATLGGDRQKAGILGTKAGLAVMAEARQRGLGNAVMLGSTAAKLAGKAETSYISKGISGLLQYMEANPSNLNALGGPEGDILKKLRNKQPLSTEEIMLIQKEGFLDRLGEQLGMTDSERYNMFQQTYRDTTVGDTVAIQAGMQSKYGSEWATDYIDAISAGNRQLTGILSGSDNSQRRSKLIDFTLRNFGLFEKGMEAELKDALLEEFKGDAEMTRSIQNDASLKLIGDVAFGGITQYAKKIGAPSAKDASNAYIMASSLMSGITAGTMWGAISDEASKTFKGFTSNVSAALREDPNLSLVELWQRGAGEKDLSKPEERNKALELAAVHSLGYSYDKATGDIKGLGETVNEDTYNKAQNAAQALTEAGLMPLFLKVRTGVATQDETDKFNKAAKAILSPEQKNALNTVLSTTKKRMEGIVSQSKPVGVNGKAAITYTGKKDEKTLEDTTEATPGVTEEENTASTLEAPTDGQSTIVSSEEPIAAEPEALPIVANVSESGAEATAQPSSSTVSVSESASSYDEASDSPITTKATLVGISKEAVTAIIEAIQPIVG